MAVTSGFFDSQNHDRRYNALQMSSIFDGIINDGVYSTIYNQFKISAREGMTISVDTGRGRFQHTWILNDNLLLLDIPQSEVLLDRIDAIVIQVDHSLEGRQDSIKIIKGTPSASPSRPSLAKGPELFQYPLAYVYVKSGTMNITQGDITNMIGTSECPFVIGVLKTMDIDMFVEQWHYQWCLWFEDLQYMLEGDVAANLANEIIKLKDKWHTLAKEYRVYETIDDTNNDPIQDNLGHDIEGDVVYLIKQRS